MYIYIYIYIHIYIYIYIYISQNGVKIEIKNIFLIDILNIYCIYTFN